MPQQAQLRFNGNRRKSVKATPTVPKALDMAARDRLLKAAASLFSRKGYAATTTREIVASAEVTKPVLYYYFKSKEGIYLELMQGAFAEFDALLEAFGNRPGRPAEKILDLCDRVFALFNENVEIVRLIYSLYYGPPQGAPFVDFDALHTKFRDSLRQLVEEGIRKREFRKGNPEEMTWSILGAVNIVIETELCHPERAPGQAGLRRILGLIFRGISSRKEE